MSAEVGLPTKTVTIYALTDPDTGEVRYIGQTKDAWKRYASHLLMVQGSTAKHGWFLDLQQRGRLPVLKTLEEHIDPSAARDREQWWIRHYRTAGQALTNYEPKPKLKPKPMAQEQALLTPTIGLQRILRIRQPIELARLLGIDRRHAWEILHGKIRLAPRFVLVLHERLGIPLEDLLRATVKPLPARRGRPRKSPPPETTPPPGTKGKRRRRP
jgi:hypothetical protein